MQISLESLEEALSIRRKIDHLERRLAEILGSGTLKPPQNASTRERISGNAGHSRGRHKKGGISQSGRRKLSQMMKARWAARRGRSMISEVSDSVPPPPPKA
jgi:hypothetical protein